MRRGSLLVVALAVSAALVSGCRPTLRHGRLGRASFVATEADGRLVTSSAPVYSQQGRVTPRQITCAEPSPDVAKVVAQAWDIASEMDAKVIDPMSGMEGEGSAALAASRSRAESLAQLTQRLATIQLLRDGLYRACEAYANGALTETSYAVLMSRYDDTMVTMLLGELVAGNFGQPLLVVGSTASGSASLQRANDKIDEAKKAVAEKQKARDAAKAELDEATDEDEDAKQEALSKAQKELDDAVAALTAALDSGMRTALTAQSSASAGPQSGTDPARTGGSNNAPAAPAGEADNATSALATMQRKFVENIHFEPLVVACIAALDRTRTVGADGQLSGERTELEKICPDILKNLGPEMLRLLERRMQQSDAARHGGRPASPAPRRGGG